MELSPDRAAWIEQHVLSSDDPAIGYRFWKWWIRNSGLKMLCFGKAPSDFGFFFDHAHQLVSEIGILDMVEPLSLSDLNTTVLRYGPLEFRFIYDDPASYAPNGHFIGYCGLEYACCWALEAVNIFRTDMYNQPIFGQLFSPIVAKMNYSKRRGGSEFEPKGWMNQYGLETPVEARLSSSWKTSSPS